MLRATWTHLTVRDMSDYWSFINQYNKDKPNIIAGGVDTETDGLNIMIARPFLFQCGWVTEDMRGYTYAVDLEENRPLAIRFIKQWNAIATTMPIICGHNIKFDLHMLRRIDCAYNYNNVTDTMMWIRLSMPAVPERKGGSPLSLKSYCKQYITREAADMESKLNAEKTQISKEFNERLKRYLGWRKKDIDNFFNDKVNDVEDLPENKKEGYYKWYDSLPDWIKGRFHGAVNSDDIPYNHLNRENVIYYAHLDIVWTIEVYLRTKEVVVNHGNKDIMDLENELIQPLVDIEEVGLAIDRPYLEQCERELKQYILQRRKDLHDLAGEALKCTQSLRIKELCKTRYGREIDTTANEEISLLIQDIKVENEDDPIIEFLETIQELRTLEKWYATYIIRFLKDTTEIPILYTSMNQAGTVSGRFTSDLQQFPKKGIIALNGKELFNPRKMAIVPEQYSNFVFIDESGLELRTQALYTILVSGGDLKMCRAYMPFKCHDAEGNAYENGKAFKNKEWFTDEDNKLWVPTDLHSATTLNCFDNISEEDENFHDLRYVGKRVNFA